MSHYFAKLHASQTYFPKTYARFLHNLFCMAEGLQDETEIRMTIYSGFEKYRDCLKETNLEGIELITKWETDEEGYKFVAYHAVIKPKVLLAQLDKYTIA